MKIAVLGSGNGGCAVAFDCAINGHQVSLFDFETFPDGIRAVREQGGIHSEGELEGFAAIHYSGHDIGEALAGAELIYAVGPAYSTGPFAEACRPHLKPGQMVVVCPGSCMGAMEFINQAGLKPGDDDVIVAESSTLPYAVRILEPGRIRVFLKVKEGIYLATLPARNTDRVIAAISDVYPAMAPARNILQTSLQNGNPVIHPAVTLLNTALIERTGGDFLFYEEGVTPAVGRLMKAVDEERMAIGTALDVEVLSEPDLGYIQGYMAERNYDVGYSKAPGFKGIGAQSSLDNRYFHEDVGYGLIFLQSLGRQVGVDTPGIDAIIHLASVVMERGYRAEGKRNMESLALADHSVEDLQRLVN